jgi:hypothetical protein
VYTSSPNRQEQTNAFPDYIGYIVLLSCVEIGIGCVAASLPSVLLLYKRVRGQESQSSPTPRDDNTLITIGGGRIGEGSTKEPKRTFSITDRNAISTHINCGNKNWERLSDVESDKGIIVGRGKGAITEDYTSSVELESFDNHRSQEGRQALS